MTARKASLLGALVVGLLLLLMGCEAAARQMIDPVAFLQSRCTVIRPGMPPK